MHAGVDQRLRKSELYGATYRGQGTVEKAVVATVRRLEDFGLLCEVGRSASGAVWLEGRTRRGGARRLVSRLPQRIGGVVRRDQDHGIRVSLDPRLAPTVRRGFYIAWVGWILALGIAFALTEPGESNPMAVVWLGLFATIVGGALPIVLRPVVFGGTHTELWTPILEEIERGGGHLEPTTIGLSRRARGWALGYGLSFGAIGVYLITDAIASAAGEASQATSWVLALFLLVAVLLLGLAGALARVRGLGERSDAIVLGVASSATFLLLLGVPLPLLASWDGSLTGPPPPVVWSRTVLAAAVVVAVTALVLGAYGLASCRLVTGPLVRMHRLRSRPGIYRHATRGGEILRVARVGFGAYTLLVAPLVLAGLALSACWAVQAWTPMFDRPYLLRLPEWSQALAAAALKRPVTDPLARCAAACGCTCWALTLWIPWMSSVGELAWKRRSMARTLEDVAARGADRHRRLRKLLDGLVARAGVGEVGLAVLPERRIRSYAWERYLPGPKRWIAVTQGALDRLPDPELEALLAHELAHLLSRHVRAQDLARWLGRVALLGDGFVRGLIDGHGWESRADEVAVERLGADPKALIRCLWIVAAVPDPGDPRQDDEDEPARSARQSARSIPRSERTSWREGWRIFRRQHLDWSPLRYWHPSVDERVERLRNLAGTGSGKGSS